MKPVVLDSGALIALEKRNGRMLALLRELTRGRTVAHVPAGVLAQVWRGTRGQQPIASLMKAHAVRVHALTEEVAYRIGRLLASSRTSDAIDAHVALLARAVGASVVTSDPGDITRLDSKVTLILI